MVATTTDDKRSSEGDLIAVVREFVNKLQPQHANAIDISPSSRIERDLGIDSLGRTELILRIERAFRVRLPTQIVGEADTIGDLINALEHAGARPGPARTVQAPSDLPPVPAATEAGTLVEVLDWHVAQHPDRLHLTVLQDDTTALGAMTYAELAESARAVAAGLIRRNVEPGDRVALMLPTSLDFFSAFFGILYAGAVPVPIYPPMRLSQIEDHLRRQAGILRNAGARILVTMPEGMGPAALLRGQVESLDSVENVTSLSTEPTATQLPPVTDDRSTALIQYTSGSTGDPKGVVLSHANLLANVRAMGAVMEASSADVFVSWLPLYHDMGLIGAWLGCLHFGAPLYAMSPLSFLVRPESWLWAMHRFRATLSASPNFGFEFCLNKIDDADLEGLDLSSLRMVANGAEPVSVQTLRRFIERFEHHGFKPGAMAPVYGLAENTVGLAFPPPGRLPIIDRVDRTALTGRGVATPAGPDDPKRLEIVACGHPLPGHEIRIVDGTGREVGDRQEGRLEFRGPSATSGYFRNDAKTRELFRDGWLDSGDRAYVVSGDVYITGRVKDIIIRAGRHIYPQEVEEAVAGIPGVRKGGVVVFGATDRSTGTERVVVVAETRETDESARAELQKRAHEVATDIAGTPPDDVVLAPPRAVPKTSSGKIRGTFGAPQRSLWWQVLRLSLAGAGPRLKRLRRLLADVLYAGWWWIVVACSLLLAWLAVMLLPRLDWRWAAVRMIAHAALALAGVTITASGIEHISRRNAILAFNHSSYMDALVLAAGLPGEPAFVAKKELAGQVFAGPFLRRLGTLFVERYDVTGSVSDAEILTKAARQERILVFFPEGTFTRRPGLSAFYLGAFKVAVDANLPVLPGIIRGTRSMLRGDQWFPRWTPVTIEIGAPIVPSGTDFESALRLRDAARQAILARCGEPDLGEMVKPTRPEAES
ncbi:MAG: acyl-phosphate glycerol 3-phosphate acyltransferase [Mesorhizobium sp.]|uniref:AMP-binding protein n=1 Tax=unclassified Mesorhizobium TaxID=325217 RepID=UPI000FCA5473|nr:MULTISPECIES: AMP-binding protein [unclassified Mesorhizobium]RUV69745.1 acyl-phosphate glycerol 3-phosphate acyltransferase [Mesorhizobium sp. M5C.F.Cr.IN.023.01.1.1]RWI53629.1 MAG: acyl-phosphate glycerol 3-phosphate acyltransferase [Mesorhizobium sp.]RWJ12878.1 MAG: acyl-phosphate glycerol 3-phosphate acyltransferase [Mesorhizobium sp.]RWJ14693.1 MAG: acyl-phosphate glycerol 3-phosphate acyltransferase [Mesorhizobium sp.]RWJ21288.1 MAG: acyl-phosphate glycerol 3-phosphate acyltransferase